MNEADEKKNNTEKFMNMHSSLVFRRQIMDIDRK